MTPVLRPGRATFGDPGECVLDDPFKPYLHPLRTPAGHVVTDAVPMDHRHHKGLMYALRAADLNFWEEDSGQPDCGVQEITGARVDDVDGDDLVLDVLWRAEAGGRATYRETRRIRCDASPDAFVWTWRSHRTALRDHRLVMSPWSLTLPDGRRVNYHGLGIRLPWAWAFSGDNFCGATLAGERVAANVAAGTIGPEVGWLGRIDGHRDPPTAAVTIRQDHGYTWFALKGDFAYLAAGPSNHAEVDVAAGQTFDETYVIRVADIAR